MDSTDALWAATGESDVFGPAPSLKRAKKAAHKPIDLGEFADERDDGTPTIFDLVEMTRKMTPLRGWRLRRDMKWLCKQARKLGVNWITPWSSEKSLLDHYREERDRL